MKKNNRKKLLALMMAFALMVGCTVGGTLAWLIAKTEPVVNTFTVGNIDIVLQEHVVDPVTGKIDETKGFTAKGNEGVKLMPGREIDKDPTVTVRAGSERCYVRMYMIFDYTIESDNIRTDKLNGWFDIEPSEWQLNEYIVETINNTPLGYIMEYQYKEVVDATTEEVKLPALFTKISIPTDLEDEQFNGLAHCKVIIVAQAVQAAGFKDADEAFKKVGRPENIAGYVNKYEVYYEEKGHDKSALAYPAHINLIEPSVDQGENVENEQEEQ